MTRMTFAFRHQKGLHQLFLISVWIKGLSGILETLAGIVAVFVEPRALESVVLFLTATELSEDPDDWFATFLGGAVRQYSAELLEAAEQTEASRLRHGDYYLSLAEEAEPRLRGPQQTEWLNRLEIVDPSVIVARLNELKG